VALLSDLDNSNTGRANLGFGANDRPNVLRNPELSERTQERWFDTSAFALPPFGSFGNAGRNILTGPGYQSINASLLKNLTLSERAALQFRVERSTSKSRTQSRHFLRLATFGRSIRPSPRQFSSARNFF
jgi:hypothetical protein